MEVVDCDIKQFLPSHPYIDAAESLIPLVRTLEDQVGAPAP